MNAIKQSVVGWCVIALLCLGLLCLTASSVLAAPTADFTSPVTIQGAITITKIQELDFGIIEVADSTRDFRIAPDGNGGIFNAPSGGAFTGGHHEGRFIISSSVTDRVALTWSPATITDNTGVDCESVPSGNLGIAPILRSLKLIDDGNNRFDRDESQSVFGGVTVNMGAKLRVDPGTRGDWICNFSVSADFE